MLLHAFVCIVMQMLSSPNGHSITDKSKYYRMLLQKDSQEKASYSETREADGENSKNMESSQL